MTQRELRAIQKRGGDELTIVGRSIVPGSCPSRQLDATTPQRAEYFRDVSGVECWRFCLTVNNHTLSSSYCLGTAVYEYALAYFFHSDLDV